MPPPLPVDSDAESVADDRSTPKPASVSGQAKDELNDALMDDAKLKDEAADTANADEEGSSGEEGDEEVYVVEKILDHRTDFPDGEILRYWIKWKGYEKKSDRTWEPIENLSDSREILEEYWESIGGEPTVANPKTKKAGRKSLTAKRSSSALKADDSESPAPKKQKHGRKSVAKEESEPVEFRGYVDPGADNWRPPAPKSGTWDALLQKVDTIEQDEGGEKWVYLCWDDKNSDGRFYRSKARLATVYKAAPQKMLTFYEQHLVFTVAENTHTRKQNGTEGQDE